LRSLTGKSKKSGAQFQMAPKLRLGRDLFTIVSCENAEIERLMSLLLLSRSQIYFLIHFKRNIVKHLL
jgi:hypothetical protein